MSNPGIKIKSQDLIESPLRFPAGTDHSPAPATEPIGDQLWAIFHKHRSPIIRFLKSRLGSETAAQDAAHDAIFRLYQQRHRLHATDLQALLYVTARNIANDRIRSRQRSSAVFTDLSDNELEDIVDGAACPERIFAARERLSLIKEILCELPAKCQDAFRAYKFEDIEYSDIAVRMHLTESMVRKYVQRALAHCAARLNEMEGPE
jgi:RNA polymerase sigma-70 factor (ECF subfamily)